MALRDWISNSQALATATFATVATLAPAIQPTVAGVATVAVADDGNDISAHPDQNHVAVSSALANERIKELLPPMCVDCDRRNLMEILGMVVPGCLYTAPGEYSDGWRRIPMGSSKCIGDSLRTVDVHSTLRSSLTSESRPDCPGKRWVEENRQALHDAGFTDQDLYGENPVGISRLILIQKPNLEIHLDGDKIRFTWPGSAGKMITQTCTPERRRRCDS